MGKFYQDPEMLFRVGFIIRCTIENNWFIRYKIRFTKNTIGLPILKK